METKCLPDFQIFNYKTQSLKTEKYPVKVEEHFRVLIISSTLEQLELRSIQEEKESLLITFNTETKSILHTIIPCHQVPASVVIIMDKEVQIQELVDHQSILLDQIMTVCSITSQVAFSLRTPFHQE